MPAQFKIGKLVVIGVGLIGGSFALALRKARAVRHVVGVGRTRRNLSVALRLGVIDEIAVDAATAVRGADFVLLGMPVGQMPGVMARIAPHLARHAVVSDAGSTKQDVIASARRFLKGHLERFVPAHPVAGTEKSGADAAFAALYRNRNVILTPQAETSRAALATVRHAWEACGARVLRLRPDEHDAIFAAVSHLPHVAAFALVTALARRPNARKLFGFSAGGLRDTVRIAGSSPEMWRDICLSNRVALLEVLDAYMEELERARGAIAAADAGTLGSMFAGARAARARWLVPRQS
jgi:prephenate dehydrogenase